MSVSVQVMGILGRRMEVAVPAARVEKAFSLRLQTVSRTAKIKGFRPGKAPLDIVRRQHGGQVREEVVNELIGQALSESLRQEGLQPVGQPQVEPLSMGSGEDLRFAAHFEVYPTVTLQGHEGMELSLPQLLVEQAIRELQTDMLRRMGARDAKALPPRDPFVEPARKRVQIGLLMTELVNTAGIQIEASVLEQRIAEAAAQTQNPEEAEKQYRSNPQVMQQLQMAVLEEAALEWVASRANVTPQPVSFREVMNFGAEA